MPDALDRLFIAVAEAIPGHTPEALRARTAVREAAMAYARARVQETRDLIYAIFDLGRAA